MDHQNNAVAGPGPSSSQSHSQSQSQSPDIITPPETAEIPSFGLEFFEYRRRLFLAGLPLPESTTTLPPTYTIALPLPEPVPPLPRQSNPNSSVGRLETLLEQNGVDEVVSAWKAVGGVHAKLTDGKRLARPLRLGLVIKILRAGWIKDGTWPVDHKTKRALPPPDSPPLDPAHEPTALPTYIDPLGQRKANPPELYALGEEMVGDDDLRVGDNVWRGAEAEINQDRDD